MFINGSWLEEWLRSRGCGGDHAAHSGSNKVQDTCSWSGPVHVICRWGNDNGDSLNGGGQWLSMCSTELECLDLGKW